MPNLASQQAEQYKKTLEDIKKINCIEKECIANWYKISIVAVIILGLIILLSGAIYLVYKASLDESI